MTRLVFSPRALLDMERLAVFLRDNDAATAQDTVPTLMRGLAILTAHLYRWRWRSRQTELDSRCCLEERSLFLRKNRSSIFDIFGYFRHASHQTNLRNPLSRSNG